MSNNPVDPMDSFKKAFDEDDAVLFARLLEQHPQMKAKINEPVAAFDSPVVTRVRSRKMLDVLLEAGADINAKSPKLSGLCFQMAFVGSMPIPFEGRFWSPHVGGYKVPAWSLPIF